MSRSTKISSLLALLLLPVLCFSQEFFKHYPTVYDRTARDVMRNGSTGEYLIAGASNNSNQADGDVYVMRTSSDGTFLWDTVYGGTKPDYAYSMTETDDGNYIVVGYSQSRPGGGGDMDIYMLKLTPFGRKLNEKWIDISSNRNDEARAIIKMGTDYYVIGSTGMPPSTTVKSDMVLLKIDHDLNVVDTKTYGGSDHEYGLSIADPGEGGLLIAGKTLSEGAGMGDAYVIKLNSSLVKEWSSTFGDQYDEEIVGLAVNHTDNTAMLAIRDSMPGAATDGNIDVVLQKINLSNGAANGTAKSYGGLDKDTPKTIRRVSTGGYIVGAISRSWWPDAPQMWLIRTDDDGISSWIYDYGDLHEHDHCHMIKEDYDGRFIAVGHQRLSGIMKVGFLRTNDMGTVGIKESSKVLTGVKAYPNPSSDGNVSLSFSQPGNYQVEIVNMMGQQIQKDVVNLQQPGVYSLQLPSTGAGIYIVNVKGGEGSFTARLIVE